jgi:chorismate mutase
MTDSCCRALRGAITVEENTADEILKATSQLLLEMVQKNAVSIDDMVSIFLTMTPDLNATFPALAARSLGWSQVPLLCSSEIAVPGGLPRCIRVLMHINSEKKQSELKHVYLREAVMLRQDLMK